MIAYRIAARSVLRRPRQALLIGIAIVAAAAFAAASLLIATNARTALVAFGMSTPEQADVVVLPTGNSDAEEVVGVAEGLRAMADEVAVEYLGDVEVQIGGTTSTWKLTSDPGSGPLSALDELHAGAPPQVGEVVLGAATAERVGASVGDELVANGMELTVAAIGPVHEFGMDVALVREQDAAAMGDVMAPVRIFATGDLDLDAVKEIAGDALVQTGDERRAEEARTVTDTLVGVFGGLSVFVGLAILSAAVIVSSTFRILLTRRATELALLRCVGASRALVRRSVLAEAGFIGFIGGVLGVAIGFGISAVLMVVARSFGLISAPFEFSIIGLIGCVLLAVVSAVVAALPAAREAGKTSPVTALGEARSSNARPVRRGARMVLASALALTAIASAAAGVIAARTQEAVGLGLAALSGTLVFIALVVVGPFLIKWAAAVMRPLASRSVSMKLAISNSRRASRRTASMATVLTLGVGLTAALIVGVAGATADSRESVARNFPSEAIIPIDLVNDPADVVEQLAAHPDLDARIEGNDILIDPAPGVGSADLRAAVLDVTDAGTPVYWAADVLAGIEQTIVIGQIIGATMIGVTMLVALIGVLVTLALSVTERRQEIALLRALGLTRAVTRRSIGAEAMLAALVAVVTGIGFGTLFGILALHVLGMSTGLPPVGSLAGLAAGVIVATILAAALPMRTAGRVAPAIGLAAR